MKKLFLISIILMSLMASLSFGALTDNLTQFWTFDNTTSPISDSKSGASATLTGAGSSLVGQKVGNSWNFTSTTGYFTTANYSGLSGSQYSSCFWLYYQGGSTNPQVYDMSYTGGSPYQGIYAFILTSNNALYFREEEGGTTEKEWATSASFVTSNTWQYHCIVRNGTTVNFYRNGVSVQNVTTAGAGNTVAKTSGNSFFAQSTYSANRLTGSLDELGFWNRTLTASEVSQLYNSGSGLAYPFSTTTTTNPPSFVAPTPANNSHNNTQITINLSCSNANLYTLWFNGSKVLDNVSTSYYTTNLSGSGTFQYFGACYNGSASGLSANSSVYTWVYDVVYPSITFNANNAFNSLNVSQVDQYNNTLPMNITFSDNILLYAYEINITKSGITFYNETNQSLTGTSYTYTKTLNVSSWADGVYQIDVKVSDSHTAKEIKDYDVVKASKKLDFDTAEGNKVTIESEDDAVTNAEKDFDRYSFEFDFSQKNKKTRVYHVKSDHPIVYLANSPYSGHFIVFNEKFGGNWIDFEGAGEKPEVVKISDYDYKVIFRNSPDKVKFHSIGGLNTYQAVVSWYKGSKVLTANSAGTSEPAIISLNLSRESVSQTNFTAMLVYNGTVYGNVSRSLDASQAFFSQNITTPASDTTVAYYWLVNLTQSDASVLYLNFSGTQSVFNWYVDNCTNSSTKTINLFIYNEETPASSLIGNLEVEIKSWISSEDNSHYNHWTLAGAYNYSLCIYPNTTMYVDLYAKYTSNLTHRFYLQNEPISNVSSNYTMYNVNSSTPYSSLQITLRKVQDYSYYPLILAKLQRRYVGEGVWRTVQMDQSGSYGLVSFDIRESDTDYQILFYDEDNNLLKNTETLSFVCSSRVCQVTQMLDPLKASAVSDNITVTHSLDNATNMLSIAWNDPQANNNKVELRVTKETFTGTATICDVFQTGSAGTYNCNLTGYSGDVLLTVLTSHSPYTPIISEWIALAKLGLSSMLTKGESATWTAGIMITTIGAGVAFGPIGGLAGGIIGLIINSFLGMASWLTITFIFIAIAIAIAIGIKMRQ